DVFSPAITTGINRHNYTFSTFEGSYTVSLSNHPRFFDQKVDVVVTPATPSVAPVLQLQGRDGILSGTVKETAAGGGTGPAIAGATVQIISQVVNPGVSLPALSTGPDGKWATATTVPSDLYTIQISKFGYSSLTLTDVFVAGDTSVADALLVKAPRGQVYGLARRGAAGPARTGVKIEFWTPAGSPFGQFKVAETTSAATTTPGADSQPANYVIGDVVQTADNLPAGTYQVRVTGDPRFAPFSGLVTVQGGAATRFDLNLTPLGGVLTGLVKEDVVIGAGQVAGPPIANATVKITLGASTIATVTTDSNGQYQTPSALPPADYTVTATAFGYQTNSVNVFVEGPTAPPATPDVLLERQPPATINGIISRKNTSPAEYVDGVALELLDVNNGNAVVATATSTASTSGINYTISSVPAGNYAIRATKPGWNVFTTTSFVVVPNTIYRKDLQIEPQHTFGQGLLLISLPQDFPGQDAAGILGSSSSDFKSAYWRTASQDYAYYHLGDQEAKEFRLGKAMFVRFDRARPFVKAGAPAPNVPFSIPVQPGWNMIGSVRTQRVEWLRVNVATPDGQVRTMQQAMNDRIVGNGLFTYIDRYSTSNFMDPFVGYFMKANESCTLIVPPLGGGASASATAAERAKVARTPVPSLAKVAAEIEAAGLGPVAAGRRAAATQPEWAANATRLGYGAASWSLGAKSINNPFEFWAWKPGLG
ncbi:MAG: Periplasmic component of the Tol biopolymer transport system, partial [Armatimonadetes bacterium]|nr:Periplasmic component of the Tol biopolymer transport system [Armatimonadota bacterium]